MATKRRNIIAAALIAAGLIALLWWRGGGDDGNSPTPAPAAGPTATAAEQPARPAQRPPAAAPAGPGRDSPIQLAPAVAGADPDAAAGLFAGRVVNWGSGRGVAGAEIVFSGGAAAITVTTGDDGGFRFAPAEPGRYRLAVASADGFLPYAPAWDQSPIELIARAGMRVDGILVYLSPAVDYIGTVVDPTGAPVAGAAVRLLDADSGERTLLNLPDRFTTASDGRFTFHAPDGAVLEAHHDCCPPGRARLDGPAQVSHQLTITLGRGRALTHDDRPTPPEGSASIRGKVTAAGDPVPAFAVTVLARDGLVERPVGGGRFFDADGEFAVGDLPEGEYLVRVMAFGFAPSRPVAATASPAPTPVSVTLAAGGTLFGTVVDGASGEPLALARVSIENSVGSGSSALPMTASTVTADDGSFELPGLPPGNVSVVVAAFAHHSRIVGGLAVAEGARIGPMTLDLTPTEPGERPKLELAGIGCALGASDDGLRVQRLIPGGGAADAGLAVGDVIIAVDGVPVTEVGFGPAIQQIRGIEGTTVSLRVRRADRVDDVVATRKRIRT